MAPSLLKLSSKFLKLSDRLNEATMAIGEAASGDEEKEVHHEIYTDRLSRQMTRLTWVIACTPASSAKELVQKAHVVMDWLSEDGDIPNLLSLSLCRDVIHLHGDETKQ